MPTYVWADNEHLWTVVTTVDDRDTPSSCPECKAPGVRQITLPNLDRSAASAWNNQQFNPALGCYTRNDQHAKKIAKARGLEEVGNEPVENIHKFYEKKNTEIREKRWVEATRDKMYE